MNAIKNWALRHAQTAVGTLGRLSQQWVSTTFMVLVIGVALALPACLQVVLINARTAGGDWNRAIEISAYFKVGTPLAQAQQAAATLRKRTDIADIRFIPADEAIVAFRKRAGFGDALAALTDNPLPHALVIRPVLSNATATDLQSLVEELRKTPNMDVVKLDSGWVEKFNAIVDAVRRAASIIAALLAIAVIVIVGNAIRADIESRREEIEVTKLVGGSNSFVRRPFLYTGVWFGLIGGLLALIVTYIAVVLMAAPIRRLALLYSSGFELSGLGFVNSLVLLAVAVALGWLGSYAAATRHLRAIEPK